MKALSVRQPWVHAIVAGWKPIENRTRRFDFKGPLAIHASSSVGTLADFDEAVETIRALVDIADFDRFAGQRLYVDRVAGTTVWRPSVTMLRGGLVGVARLDGVLRPGTVDHAALLANREGIDLRWHAPGAFGHVLLDVRAVPFVPFKGMLGLFEVPDELIAGAA